MGTDDVIDDLLTSGRPCGLGLEKKALSTFGELFPRRLGARGMERSFGDRHARDTLRVFTTGVARFSATARCNHRGGRLAMPRAIQKTKKSLRIQPERTLN
jgi:hypothetical protein